MLRKKIHDILEKIGLKKLQELDWNTWYPLFFTVAFIFILFHYRFSTFDAIFYDLWQKTNVLERQVQEVVTVVLNEESDQFLGETYPYSYASHFNALERIIQQRPKAIAYLMNFYEPDNQDEQEFFVKFYHLLKSYQDSGGIVRFQSEFNVWGVSTPIEPISEMGYSPVIINIDSEDFARDSVHRKMVLTVGNEDTLPWWLAQQYQHQTDKVPIPVTNIRGAFYNINADAYFTYYHFLKNPLANRQNILQVPMYRVSQGNMPDDIFENKIVMLGTSYYSNADDYVLTPFSKVQKAPKINVLALQTASLIRGRTISAVPLSFSQFLALIITIFLSVLVSRVHPSQGLSATIGVIVATVVLAYFSTTLLGYWPKVAHIILSFIVVFYIWVPFRAIAEHQTRFAIEEEAKLLKKVDGLKQNFISLMSHDLKTPVAKITGIVDLLRLKIPASTETQRLIDDVQTATSDLNNFINSILDLTKIESRNLKLNLVSKDLNSLIEQISEKLIFEAERKDMKIELNLEPLYPIQMDQLLAKRIISNLIENSIKYAGKGCIITVKTWDDDKWVYLEIGDNGVGIPLEEQPHIFEKFYRVKTDQSHSIRGSGLGLYLVKYFLELMGGKIALVSVPGEGTTFKISFRNE